MPDWIDSFSGSAHDGIFPGLARHFCKILVTVSALLFAGVAQAAPVVGIAVENELDSNGNITVIEGGIVGIAYTTISDPDKVLDKKDRIELRRVGDDSLVDSVFRGKKKNGTVSLKAKNAAGDALYVQYKQKGKNGDVLATEHDTGDDPNATPLLVIAKPSLDDLAIEVNALKNDILTTLFAGDGSAGDLVVSSNTFFSTAPPANPNFDDITIDAGRTLTVPAGTTLRCRGSLVNNGTIQVQVGTSGVNRGFSSTAPSTVPFIASRGDAYREASPPEFHNGYDTTNPTTDGGLGGDGIPRSAINSGFGSLSIGGGAGSGWNGNGEGGGLLKIYCGRDIINLGTINANGDSAFTAGGGGGGGIVILGARNSVDVAAGTINARGGDGGIPGSGGFSGRGGGGGGGIVVLAAPEVNSNRGNIDVSGGSAGSSSPTILALKSRIGGGGGGASGGDGGNGGSVSNSGYGSANDGVDGYVLTIIVDPVTIAN